MLEVEIRGPYKQFYKVYLYNISEKTCEICVKDDYKSTLIVPLSLLYRTVTSDYPSEVKIGDEIEVYIQLNTTIPIGPLNVQLNDDDEQLFSKLAVAKGQLAWWPALVQNIRGDYLVVRIIGIAGCTDVVEKAIVRSIVPCSDEPNTSPGGSIRRPIDCGSIYKRLIRIPPELTQCSRDISIHKHLLRYCHSPATLYYDEKKAQLTVLAFDGDVIRQVELLEDTYVKMLRQKWNLMQSMEQATKRLEHTRLTNNKSANFVESFTIPQVCMGLAIGSKGVTIQAARQVAGVVCIDVCDETCGFVIYAKTMEAIKAARQMVEYSEAVMAVPRNLVARIIGKSGSNIQSVVDKSGVVRVRIENNQRSAANNKQRPMRSAENEHTDKGKDQEQPEPGTMVVDKKESINFVFIGTIESIDNAKLLISFQIESLQELDSIQQDKAEILRELYSVESVRLLVRPGSQAQAHNQRSTHLVKTDGGGGGRSAETGVHSLRHNGRGSEVHNTATDEYSLAPGGPPSRDRWSARHGRETASPVDGVGKHRPGRPSQHVASARGDSKKCVTKNERGRGGSKVSGHEQTPSMA